MHFKHKQMKRFIACVTLSVVPSSVLYGKTARWREIQHVRGNVTSKAQGNRFGQKGGLRDKQFNRDQYEAALGRLDTLVRDNNRAEIVKMADEFESEWRRAGGELFG